jgi:hypothetical protein
LAGCQLSVVGFALGIAAVNRRRGQAVKGRTDRPARGEFEAVSERR